MIRLTTEQAELLRQLANDLKETVVKQGVDMPPLIAQALEVAEVLKGQLDAPAHEGDLVDTVADILNELPPGGALTGVRLSRLRLAVLSPSELVKVKEAPTAVNCTGCGCEIGAGSLFTHFQTRIRCLGCQQAESIQIRCKDHRGTKVIALPDTVKKRLRLLMKKTACPACTAPPTEAPEVARPADNDVDDGTLRVEPPRYYANPNVRPGQPIPTPPRPRPLFVGEQGAPMPRAGNRLTPEQAREQLRQMDRERAAIEARNRVGLRQWGIVDEGAPIPQVEWQQAPANAIDPAAGRVDIPRPGDHAEYWLAGPEEE